MSALYSIFLIDDEPWVLKGLRTLLRWEDEGFSIAGQYTNSYTALDDILRLSPDVVITDISMPRIDGLTLMERARAAGYDGPFVILTGYDEFGYAQRAIEQGTFSYLLKPIDREQVLDVARKLRRTLDERQLSIVGIEPDDGHTELLHRLLGEGLDRYCTLAVHGDWEPLLETSEKILRVRAGKARALYLLATEANQAELTARWEPSLARAEAYLGMSGPFDDLARFSHMLRRSEIAVCDACWRGGRRVNGYRSADTALIGSALAAMKENGAGWEDFRRATFTHASLADVTVLLNETSIRTADERDEPGVVDFYEIEDVLMLFSSIDEAFAYIERLMRKDDSEAASLQRTIIDDICAWIDEHYAKPIRLSDLSRHFHISETYICELFRKHRNQTLTQYVLSVRMDKAAALLRNSSIPLLDVAEEVGYLDYGYFGRVFRHTFGVSPNAFRKADHVPSVMGKDSSTQV